MPVHDAAEMNVNEEDSAILVSEQLPPDHNVAADGDYEPVAEESSTAPEVRGRAKNSRFLKGIGVDVRQELRNSDLAQWNSEYVRNMIAAKKVKQNNKLITQARKNAAFWVIGSGIGSVGIGIGVTQAAHPLNGFSGDQLYDSLTGDSTKISGRKRGRPPINKEDDSDEDERRVRMRENEDEDEDHFGRGDDVVFADDQGVVYDVGNTSIIYFLRYFTDMVWCRIPRLAVMHPLLYTTIHLLRCHGT